MLSVNKDSDDFLYRQVIDLISENIESGTLRPGERQVAADKIARFVVPGAFAGTDYFSGWFRCAPGEAVIIEADGTLHSRQCGPRLGYTPCLFEYVYFARPDSIIDRISVYKSRLRMGEVLADKILRERPDHDIDVVIPIPDSSRTSALEVAVQLDDPLTTCCLMKAVHVPRDDTDEAQIDQLLASLESYRPDYISVTSSRNSGWLEGTAKFIAKISASPLWTPATSSRA